MRKFILYGLLLLFAISAMAQMPNYYAYDIITLDNAPYKYSFMDVTPIDTVVVGHRIGYSPWEYDTIIGNYVMITPTYSDEGVFCQVISVNGQNLLCPERINLHFIPTPQPVVTVTNNLCISINDTNDSGHLNHKITIFNMDSGTVEGRFYWYDEYPIQVCDIPSGSYTIVFYYILNDFEYKKNLYVTIP